MSVLLPPGVLLLLIRASTGNAFCKSDSRLSRVGADEQIFTSTFEMLATLSEDATEDEPMLPLAQMGLMMVDWQDPQKTVYVSIPTKKAQQADEQ